jgi:ech hydrogenase subunit A
MTLLPILLIAVPILFGFVALAIRRFRPRRAIVVIASLAQGLVAIAFAAWAWPQLPLRLHIELPGSEFWIPGVELALAAYIAALSARKRRFLALLLAIAQAIVAVAGERWTGGVEASGTIFVDQLSILLILIVGVVGGLVLFDASGYMVTYHEEHPSIRDRRQLFSFMMLVFFGAMYGIVICNDLRLMLLFWEITTLASFLLIGYAGDEAAEKSAFRALELNLLGGLAFSLGIALLAARTGMVELDRMVSAASWGGASLVAAPAALLALAGLVKSAQMPFTPWLLGAMVAPTPVSALLHSSTMVKAGVYLIMRLGPVLGGTPTGYLVAFIGIFTFIAGAFAAVSQRNAKRILAFSTVSNLGLIVACAGVGTYQLAWVAFFLVMFHAVAKALLFLSVGTASVGTGSLDVESMGGLIVSMPRTTLFLVIGISAMFIAPFGMLVSKWAAMEAFINMPSLVSPLMIVFLAYGSATTVLFWAKWLGILVRVPDPEAPRGLAEGKVTFAERFAEAILAVAAVACCIGFPIVSKRAVEPYLLATYGMSFGLDRSNAMITVLMVVMTMAVPGLLLFITRRRKEPLSGAYMSGRTASPGLAFRGSKGATVQLETRSYYLDRFFAERRILSAGIGVGILLVISMLGASLL